MAGSQGWQTALVGFYLQLVQNSLFIWTPSELFAVLSVESACAKTLGTDINKFMYTC